MLLLATLSVACSAHCSPPALPQDHGNIHSPDAEFVWRIPNLAGLGGATAKSPAGQLLADPEFEAWIRGLTGRADFEVPKTIQEAYGLARNEGPAAEWDFVTELLWGERVRGVSVSARSSSGSMMKTVMGLRQDRTNTLTPSIMEHLHLRWAIEFSSEEDRIAWLASAIDQFESRANCTISKGEGLPVIYRWAVGENSAAGPEPMQEGTLRLVGPNHAVIETGNPTLAGAAPADSSHPLFPNEASSDDVTAAIHQGADAPGSLPWENPETAPLEELLAVCAGPMAEVMSLPGQMEWVAGDGASTLRMRRGPGARTAVGTVPLSKEALALVHPEAHVAVVTGIDQDAFAAAFRAVGAGDEILALFAQAQPEVGISVLPISRGFLPQVLIAFGTENRAATRAALEAACEQIAASTRREVFFARAEYRGAFYVTPRFKNPGVLESLIQPCIVVTEDRIFIATDAALAKREIRRLQTEAPRRIHASLASMDMPEAGVTLAACADWAALITDLHGRADGILKAIGPMAFGPVTPEMLPPLELLTRYLTPSQRWVAISDAGFTEQAQTPFGPCEFSIAAALLVSWFTVQVDDQISTAEIVQAEADITTIHAALQRYYLKEARWPDRLSELPLNTTDPRDPWGSAYRFRIDPEGDVLLWSIGPDLMDEKGEGDDISLKELMRR